MGSQKGKANSKYTYRKVTAGRGKTSQINMDTAGVAYTIVGRDL